MTSGRRVVNYFVFTLFFSETTDLRPDNPNWLGAWWLGVLIVGASLIIVAIPMATFPRELRRSCKHSSPKKFRPSLSEGELLKCNGNIKGVSTECQNCQMCPQSAYYAPRNEDMAKPSLRGLNSSSSFSCFIFFTVLKSLSHLSPISQI